MHSVSTSVVSRDFAKGDLNTLLHPWYVTGLVDAEGSFGISIVNHLKLKFEFKVTQKRSNAGILYDLERFFDVGSVVIDNRTDDTIKYHVTSQESLINVILPHFMSFPLVTSKQLNLASFKQALLIATGTIERGDIQTLKQGMNKGRSFADKFNSLSVVTLAPEWVQAFVDGEGTFYAYVALKKTRNTTYQGVDLSLEVGQASHDIAVLASLASFFNGGAVMPKCDISSLEAVQAIRAKSIYKLRNVDNLIKFFDQYLLLTDKQLDYQSFKAIWNIKSAGKHTTAEGLAKIKELKANMNKSRTAKPMENK